MTTTNLDNVNNSFIEESIVWVGDNLGGEGEVFVEVRTPSGEFFLNLEQALRSIDQFFEYGRNRILRALGLHFHLEAA